MKAIILNLIREDIKQTRFIQQLNNLGLSADDHLLNLSPIIFDLMQLDRSTPEKADAVQERYRELMEKTINNQPSNIPQCQNIELIYETISSWKSYFCNSII